MLVSGLVCARTYRFTDLRLLMTRVFGVQISRQCQQISEPPLRQVLGHRFSAKLLPSTPFETPHAVGGRADKHRSKHRSGMLNLTA